MTPRVFLLSPANLSGRRAEMVLNGRAAFDVALRLRAGGATIGDVFQFISGLYFRGNWRTRGHLPLRPRAGRRRS